MPDVTARDMLIRPHCKVCEQGHRFSGWMLQPPAVHDDRRGASNWICMSAFSRRCTTEITLLSRCRLRLRGGRHQ